MLGEFEFARRAFLDSTPDVLPIDINLGERNMTRMFI
jgi:hypothetical protein